MSDVEGGEPEKFYGEKPAVDGISFEVEKEKFSPFLVPTVQERPPL